MQVLAFFVHTYGIYMYTYIYLFVILLVRCIHVCVPCTEITLVHYEHRVRSTFLPRGCDLNRSTELKVKKHRKNEIEHLKGSTVEISYILHFYFLSRIKYSPLVHKIKRNEGRV